MTIVNTIEKNSDFDLWHIGENNRENTNKCLVPFVTCDENYHVVDTVYLKVASVEEAETLMKMSGYGRRSWCKIRRKGRKEIAQKAIEILNKYLV